MLDKGLGPPPRPTARGTEAAKDGNDAYNKAGYGEAVGGPGLWC